MAVMVEGPVERAVGPTATKVKTSKARPGASGGSPIPLTTGGLKPGLLGVPR
ncbi:hypothetical protein SUDANB95_04906 [Actinosynnema sp. ALI-1.44]